MSVMTDGIFSKLTTDQTVGSFYDDLSGRIYMLQAKHSDPMPLCVFNVIDDQPFRYGSNTNDIEATIQIDLWGPSGDSYKTISDINDKLFTLLDGQEITISGFTGGQTFNLERGFPTSEEDSIRILSRWRIWASA